MTQREIQILRDAFKAGRLSSEQVKILDADVPGWREKRPIAGAAEAALQGVTGGWSDEAAGAISAATGGDYGLARDAVRGRDRQHAKNYPWVNTGAKVAGSLLPALIPGGKIAQMAMRLPRAARALTGGATIGGTVGAGYSEDDVLRDAAIGAGAGGVGGLVAKAAGDAIRRFIPSQAKDRVARAADRAMRADERALRDLPRGTPDPIRDTAMISGDKMQALTTRAASHRGAISDLIKNDILRQRARMGAVSANPVREWDAARANLQRRHQEIESLAPRSKSGAGDVVEAAAEIAPIRGPVGPGAIRRGGRAMRNMARGRRFNEELAQLSVMSLDEAKAEVERRLGRAVSGREFRAIMQGLATAVAGQ